MDAIRLIETTRHALAQARGVREIVTEAWQAQALAEALGGHLAAHGPPDRRGEAQGLGEAGGRACGALHPPGLRTDAVRAGKLSAVAEPRAALLALGELLGEVGMALVGMACGLEDDPVYWECVDAIDAADDSRVRVGALLRGLAEADGSGVSHTEEGDIREAAAMGADTKEAVVKGADAQGSVAMGADAQGSVAKGADGQGPVAKDADAQGPVTKEADTAEGRGR